MNAVTLTNQIPLIKWHVHVVIWKIRNSLLEVAAGLDVLKQVGS